jgi:hypothetical protein
MKLIPSDNLLKHLIEQNVTMPLGGFDIPDTAYADIDYDLRRHPIHSGESQVEIKDRVDYAAIWRFHGIAQNSGTTGQALETVQKTASLTRQIVEMADTHLPNVAEKVSAAIDDSKNVVHAAVSELKSITHLGQQDIVQAVSDLKMFSAESHAEVLKVRGDLHADLMELLAKLHHLGKWFLGVLIAGILFLCAIGILGMILGIHAHAQSVVIIGAQKGTTPSGAVTATQADPNHTGMDIVCISGCAGSSGATTPTNAFANPTTAGMAMSFNAMWNGTSWDLVKGDTTSGVWVNCKSGCAGGSSTPTNAFANPTTAGLSMSFNMMWNGTTWDLVKGDTTNGLWVNCKTGCAGGSSTPADTFANPTTAGLQMTFPMLWNGTSWDRLYGDKTNGAFVNIKNSVALQLATGGNVIGSISNTTFAVTESGTWVMRMQDGSGNALTSNSTTYTAKFALDGNLLGTLGTAFSTPGKIDVIGTVATTPPANASTNIAQYGGTNVGAANAFHVQPGTSATWDTSDRAARLLGVVYGSQGQQLQQSATNFNAYAELRTGATAYDARQIRALTSADVATANQGTANSAANGWPVKLTDGTNTAGVAADNGQAAATNRVPILPAIALATPPAAATTGRDAALLTDLHRIPTPRRCRRTLPVTLLLSKV